MVEIITLQQHKEEGLQQRFTTKSSKNNYKNNNIQGSKGSS